MNREEIDYRAAADLPTPANYGWNRYEGTADYDTEHRARPADSSTPLVFPVQEYDHTNGDCSVIGGYVYRGSAMADEVGRYFYADLCTRNGLEHGRGRRRQPGRVRDRELPGLVWHRLGGGVVRRISC